MRNWRAIQDQCVRSESFVPAMNGWLGGEVGHLRDRAVRRLPPRHRDESVRLRAGRARGHEAVQAASSRGADQYRFRHRRRALPNTSPYVASKYAIRGLSSCLRMQLSLEKECDIHVCNVMPAAIDTPLFQHAANYTGRAVKARVPAGKGRTRHRLADPQAPGRSGGGEGRPGDDGQRPYGPSRCTSG
jgi:NAD(P)-dependent dehydrogenase (short-subunit alcohol dehydrogenase family)